MASRREVLAAGGCGMAAFGIGLPVQSALAVSGPNSGEPPALFLLDTTLAGATGALAAAEQAGIPVTAFAGDVGTVWLDRLQPLWKGAALPIAGVVRGGALFCLEQLAQGYGIGCAVRLPCSAQRDEQFAAAELLLAAVPNPARQRWGERTIPTTAAGGHALAFLLAPIVKRPA